MLLLWPLQPLLKLPCDFNSAVDDRAQRSCRLRALVCRVCKVVPPAATTSAEVFSVLLPKSAAFSCRSVPRSPAEVCRVLLRKCAAFSCGSVPRSPAEVCRVLLPKSVALSRRTSTTPGMCVCVALSSSSWLLLLQTWRSSLVV